MPILSEPHCRILVLFHGLDDLMLSYCCRRVHDCATEPKRTSENGFYPMPLVPFQDKNEDTCAPYASH